MTVELEGRDLELLRLLLTLRLATVDELEAVLSPAFASRYVLQRRLRGLFDAGYVSRPLAQERRLYRRRGGVPQVYALGNAGAKALRAAGEDVSKTDFDQRARELTLISLEHTLLVARTVAAILASVARNRELVLRTALPDGAFRTRVTVTHRARMTPVALQPDAVVVIEEPAQQQTLALLIEADRGTMPKERMGLEQSAFLRKALGYYAYRQDIERFRQELGADDFIVLTVAHTAARAALLAATTRKIDSERQGVEMFWFTAADAFSFAGPDILSGAIWKTAASDPDENPGALF